VSYPPPYPDPSKLPQTWTLASYNVKDLFDTADDPNSQDERPAENQLRNKLTRLCRVLSVLDADVIGLMEVETLGVLTRLNDALGDRAYAEAILLEGNDPERGIDVALLSRFPVLQIISHAADIYEGDDGQNECLFSRDCLECHLRLPSGETLIVLVNHFKSKRGGEFETEPLRTAQATRVHEIAESLREQYPLVAVIGDLNDTPQSQTLQPLLSEPMIDLLARDIPQSSNYSFVHRGQTERIDYLLASADLAARFVPNSALLLHDDWARRASDHAPARVAFSLTQAVSGSYPENLTAARDRTNPPRMGYRGAARINAARFMPHTLVRLQGQVVVVTGVVERVEVTRGTGVMRLLLGNADPFLAIQVTIFPADRAAFADAGILDIGGYTRGKMVQAVGTLEFYRETPEVSVSRSGQLKVLPQEESQHGSHGI
jgi:endonuclease/exonuclease/phosphatase family metal-dependent hydrolase